ncbi:hypothetical protein JCM24511_06881 [Saitozyma sp. JCM 24511]|nr:hypothetical protein JCM24511_06881 [Saitozyma sp. JCM 24511]
MPVHQVMGLCLPAGTVSHGVVLLAPFKEVMGSECRVATGSPSSISSPFGSVRQYRAVHRAVREYWSSPKSAAPEDDRAVTAYGDV